LSLTKVKVLDVDGASSSQAVHRSQSGNGTTGTPVRAASPFGLPSVSSSHGAFCIRSTERIPGNRCTAASRRRSTTGSAGTG
jgi:hypothetical protein